MIPNLMTKKRLRKLWQAVAMLLAFAVPNAQAVTRTWNGGNGGGPTEWNRGQNWSGNTVPTGTDDALFNGSVNLTANLLADSSVQTITFSSGGGYTIGGAFILTLGNATAAGMSNNVAGVTQTFSVGTINLGASQIWSAASGDLTFNGTTIGLGASRTLTLDAGSGRTITIGNSITGSGTSGITKTGAGTLILSGASTYTGPTTISAGTLRISTGANRLPTGTAVTIGNVASAVFDLNSQNQTIGSLAGGGATGGSVTLGTGTLTVGDANNTTFAGVISGTGGIVKQGGGTLTLSGANTYSGTTVINAGTLQISTSANRLPTATAVTLANTAGAIFDLNNQNQTIGSLAGGGATGGNVTLGSGTLTIGDANNTTFAGVISGTGGVVKQGSGTLTLSGANTYSGTTVINAGTLQISTSANRLPTATAVTLANTANAILDLNNQSQTIGSLAGGGATGGNVTLGSGTLTVGDATSTTYGGVINGTGGLVKQGAGTLTLSGANTYSGTTVISAGTLQIGNNGTAGSLGSGGVTDNSALVFNRSDSITVANAITGTGTVTKQGAGTLTLTGANDYSGTTTISAGTLQIGNNGTSGSLGTGGVTDNSALVFNRSDSITVANAITGTGTVTKQGAGTLFLTGANDYSGLTTISAGTLQVGNGGTSGTLGTGSVTDDSALVFNRSDATTVGNVISGTGTLTKQGGGTLTLSGNNSYQGVTTVSAGTLKLGHDNALGNTAAGTTVGASGTLDLNGRTVGAEAIMLNGALVNSGSAASLAGNVTLNSGSSIGGSGNITLGGVVSGSSLTKSGGNTVVLTGNNTYSGGTTIGGGKLQIGNNGNSGTLGNGGVSIASGANLTVSRSDTVTLGNNVTGPGSVTVNGSGSVTLSGNNDYSGGTTLTSGTLVAGSGNALGGTSSGGITMASGTTFDLNNQNLGNVGALTLTGSTDWVLRLSADNIDTGSITFSGLSGYTDGIFKIYGWEGALSATGSPGTGDRIFFSSNPSAAFLDKVQFYSDDGITPIGLGATMVGNELVPVPEPINVALGIFGAGFVGINFARRYVAKKRATPSVPAVA